MKKARYFPLVTMLLLLLVTTLAITACQGASDTTDAATTTAPNTSEPAVTTTMTANTTTIPLVTTTTPVTTEPEPQWVSAVFGGGPFTNGGVAAVNKIKNSSFNTLILWSVHVHENGDLYMNDIPVVKNGAIVSNAVTRTWNMFHQQCPNITRYELSIGGWGCTDFENIRTLINRDGTGEDTILYKNFKALIEATGADAINYDDESCYDVTPMAKFGQMCVDMGMKVSFCPYTNMSFWVDLYKAIGEENVDRIYVQCYAGGASNAPMNWARAFGKDVIPGYWCVGGDGSSKTAAQVQTALKAAINSSEGGFMWLFDNMQTLGEPNSVADYADAIMAAGENKEWD